MALSFYVVQYLFVDGCRWIFAIFVSFRLPQYFYVDSDTVLRPVIGTLWYAELRSLRLAIVLHAS